MAFVRRWIAGIGASLAVVVTVTVAGCGSSPPGPAPSPSADPRPADRDQLAGLAAAAKDRRYIATYRLTTPGRADRTVTAAFASDGTWVVAIPGGALSGLVDIAVYGSLAGQFQCLTAP